MSRPSTKATALAMKLAAEQLNASIKRQKQLEKIAKDTVAVLEETKKKERAFKLATKLVAGEDTLRDIQEKAASLIREDMDVVEKAIDLGLTENLRLGSVVNKTAETDSTKDTNPLIDFLIEYGQGKI